MTRGGRAGAFVAGGAIVLFAAALAVRPLNANDLFWHLAAGREILAHGSIPRTDPFSFASRPGPWIDHEWLWQAVFQGVYGAFASPAPGPPVRSADLALILAGAVVVGLAFGLGARRLLTGAGEAGARAAPPAACLVLGLLAAQVARERLMVRPETASLLMLSLLLTLLARPASPGRRALLLAGVTALWSNVHPAALLAPAIVLLHGAAELARRGSIGGMSGSAAGAPTAPSHSARGALMRPGLETAACALATLANPFGWRLWTVPFTLSGLVKGTSFFNPEWLAPPLAVFPVFYALAALVALAAAAALLRRRVPDPALLTALAFALLSARQMRHMGLFAIALLFAGPALIETAGLARPALDRVLSSRGVIGLAAAGALLASAGAVWGAWNECPSLALDPRRFPVDASEWIARQEPAVRLYNDVQFGGYLIWRFFPPSRTFIDGRNELYTDLLPRLARIRSGAEPYAAWRDLIASYGIDAAIVKYTQGKVGVVYPPGSPGEPPAKGWRAWSAVLFPHGEWALVYFDDTAMVFVKRDGLAAGWGAPWEYRDLNPEDADDLLDRAARDTELASRLRAQARHRVGLPPRSERAEQFLRALGE